MTKDFYFSCLGVVSYLNKICERTSPGVRSLISLFDIYPLDALGLKQKQLLLLACLELGLFFPESKLSLHKLHIQPQDHDHQDDDLSGEYIKAFLEWIQMAKSLVEKTVARLLNYVRLLIYLIVFLCCFFEFPDGIRHICTTMPWTIWPSLLVLWGVCWMFYGSPNFGEDVHGSSGQLGQQPLRPQHEDR